VKVQCERCKEIVPLGAFRAREAGIDITCVACGESYFVAASGGGASANGGARGGADAAGRGPPRAGAASHRDPRPAAAGVEREAAAGRAEHAGAAAPAAGDDGAAATCPKCDAPVPAGAIACPRCGLSTARFAGFRAEAEELAPAALVALWETCRDRWDEPAVHAAFLEAAGGAGAYRYAAARYRAAARDAPEDGVARARLDELERRVVAALTDARTSEPRSAGRQPAPSRLILQVMIVVVLVAGAVVFGLAASGGDSGLEATNPARVDSPWPGGGQ
jgi:hypothetical protein